MGPAVRLWRLALECFPGLGARAGRLVLSLFFKALLGVARIFHFETLHDRGLALLTGGREVLGRRTLGGLLRAVSIRGVRRLMHKTEPPLAQSSTQSISIDEHVVPRFTRKFRIPKAFHTIRNKKMRAEKLVFAFGIEARELLTLVVTRGRTTLTSVASVLLSRLRRRARGAELRVILDAGAAQDSTALWHLVARPRQVTLVRAPRRPAYRKAWEALPAEAWTRHEEPGAYKNAPPTIVHVAETPTVLTIAESGRPERTVAVRTVVVREATRQGKERWHALWVFGDDTTAAWELVQEYRTRQHHEQTYRVLVHDAALDAAPSGYSKRSPNPDRPGFRQNAVSLYAWVAGLALSAVRQLAPHLPGATAGMHLRTLRRWWLLVPAELYLTPTALIVLLHPARRRSVWDQVVRWATRHPVRIPWLDDRKLIFSLDPPSTRPHPEAASAPTAVPESVWCSYGFRPGRGVHGALEHLRVLLRPRPVATPEGPVPRLPYQVAIEGDIKGCFDHIAHPALMRRFRRRIEDRKVLRVVYAFLKAGVLAAEQFTRTDAGVPQGGILSPLAANVALSAIEERYARHVWPRQTPTLRIDPEEIAQRAAGNRLTDRRRGLPVFFPIRYADDFLLLVSVPPGPDAMARALEVARAEKDALAAYLRTELGLELAEAKTLVTPVTEPMRFLGHHVRVRHHPGHHRLVSATLVPKDRSQLFRERIKRVFDRASLARSLRDQLRRLNPMLRGWARFYRHAWGAKKVFDALDYYVWWTVARWLRKKHHATLRTLATRYGWRKPGGRALRWRDGDTVLFALSSVPVEQYTLGWVRGPDFAKNIEGEPGA